MEEEEKKAGIHPAVYGVLTIIQGIAFIAAGLAALYLFYGLFSGGLNAVAGQSVAEKQRVLSNVGSAGTLLTAGLAVGSLCTAFLYFATEIAGYLLLALAGIGILGVPFVYSLTAGDSNQAGVGVAQAFNVFRNSSLVPAGVGVILVVRDLVMRVVSMVQGRQLASADLQFGGNAVPEQKPRRTSILGKCWEGGYCREYIRTQCPIFIQRKACWKERRGCYCEEDIFASASAKAGIGVQLEMAPASQYNFANPVTPKTQKAHLTDKQKAERCRNCVIYNEHQEEKYKILVPLTLILTVVLMVLIASPLRGTVHTAFGSIDKVIEKIAFGPTKVNIAKPGEFAEWLFVGALGLMACSKVLQLLEWFIFKLKI